LLKASVISELRAAASGDYRILSLLFPYWLDQHGDGSGLGAAVHSVSGDRCLTPSLRFWSSIWQRTIFLDRVSTGDGVRGMKRENPMVWALLGLAALLPLIAASPRIELIQAARLFAGDHAVHGTARLHYSECWWIRFRREIPDARSNEAEQSRERHDPRQKPRRLNQLNPRTRRNQRSRAASPSSAHTIGFSRFMPRTPSPVDTRSKKCRCQIDDQKSKAKA